MRRARLLALLLPIAAATIGPGPVFAEGHLVRITSTLEPAHMTIAPGDTVTWRNDDGDRHRMRSRSGPVEFDSGDLGPGASFRVTLTQVGTYAYLDERNDDLQRYWGTIVVTEDAPTPTDDGTSGGGGGGGGGGTGGGGSTAPATASIGMAGRTFRPRAVTIAVGGTVTFRNDDDRDHTATSTGSAFNSGVLAPGQSYRRTFPAAGTFPFLCLLHPDMTGTVTVAGGGGGGSGGGTTPPPAATPKPTPARPPAETLRGSVTIVDLDFLPGEIEVTAGGTVSWENAGVAPHTATAADGSFDSGILGAGATFTQSFPTPGRFAYLCAIHPSMTGVVVVKGAPDPAPTPGSSTSASPSASAAPGPASEASGDPRGGNGASTTGPAAGGAGTGGRGGADATNAAGAPSAAELLSTLLALGLVGGAFFAGAGLLIGVVRRAGMPEPAD